MKVGLVDVDSHNFPNLALMKISANEKKKGNDVEMLNGFLNYDKVYMSKVFDDTYSEDFKYIINADEIVKGGTGYNNNVLPDEVEHIMPDYSLYGITDTAYGFLTRGCPRHCKFCIVGDKEGLKSHQVADLREFWGGQKEIVLLDPNLTASEECDKLLLELANTKRLVTFNQGLDIRFMTPKRAKMLNCIKTKMVHFAWDNYEMKTYEKLKEIRPHLEISGRQITVYVLVNFNTTLEQDLERIYKLKELDYSPYVMIYDKPHCDREYKKLQRWVNNRWVFRSCERYEDYKG